MSYKLARIIECEKRSNLIMNTDNKIENHYNSFETPLRESMGNMGLDIPKDIIQA